jgi:uncharacterized protein (DUF1919 family)
MRLFIVLALLVGSLVGSAIGYFYSSPFIGLFFGLMSLPALIGSIVLAMAFYIKSFSKIFNL